ncbi:MAG: MgtC/SapB family protein [Planctomycetota bacterium]
MVSNALLLVTAFLLALPVGWDREASTHSAGLRTFPLVALSSCAFVVIGLYAFGDDAVAQSRVLQGLVTGIGFVGGGAIVKSEDRVEGTATAASVWTTGAIGATVAYGRLDLAVLLSAATFLTLRYLHRVARVRDPEDREG